MKFKELFTEVNEANSNWKEVRRFEQILDKSKADTWADDSGNWEHVWGIDRADKKLAKKLTSDLIARAEELGLEYLITVGKGQGGEADYTKFGINF